MNMTGMSSDQFSVFNNENRDIDAALSSCVSNIFFMFDILRTR